MDITLYYQEKGNKAPFILLHGNGEDSSYFKNQIDYFSDRYRVIALDTRGHGKSPRGTAPFTIEQFSRDLYDFMESLEISDAKLSIIKGNHFIANNRSATFNFVEFVNLNFAFDDQNENRYRCACFHKRCVT